MKTIKKKNNCFNQIFVNLGVLGVLAFTLFSCLFFSCQTKEPGKYVNRDQKFRLTFPRDWEIKENEMGLSVIALSTREHMGDDFSENVSVASSKMAKTLDADGILDANLPSMMKMITDFDPDVRGYKNIGGIKAATLTYSQRQGRLKLTTTLLAVPGKKRAYLIYCTAETKKAPMYKDIFEKIVESFEVIE